MAGDDVQGSEGALVRARVLSAIESRGTLTLLGPDGTIRKLEGDTATLALEVLSLCAGAPRSRTDILTHVAARTGVPIDQLAIVEQLLALLCAAGALVPAPAPRPAIARASGARVLLGMGGAVAAAHAPALVQALQARGFEVRVVASVNALKFVGREALEALTHHPVSSSMWERDEGTRVPHIELAAWADAVLVCPATASTLSRIATGDCSELLSAVAITTRAPVLVAPSMNAAMYESPSVQRNLETLKEDGFHLVPPTFAHEVALAPDERSLELGGAPGAETLTRLLEAMLRLHPAAPRLPREGSGWEAFHRRVPESAHAWFTPEVDPQIAQAIGAHCGAPAGSAPGLLWDIGTGHGATASWAARQGFQVVATDVSTTALSRARRRAGPLRIAFLRDDVTESALGTEFDVVVDRGTLHALPPERRAAYARQVLRCTRPGSVVIIKVHVPSSDAHVLSHPMTADEVEALFGDRMEPLAREPGSFAGTVEPAPPSVLCVLRRAGGA